MTESGQGPALPRSLGPKALMLFLLPLPLLAVVLASMVSGDVLKLAKSGVCFGLFMAGAVIMRKGMVEQVAFGLRRYAAAPPAPLKLSASLVVGLATGLSALMLSGQNLFEAVGFGLGATVGAVLLYGLDPRPSAAKQVDAAAAEVLALAEQKILDIEQANQSIACDELTQRLDRITEKARRVLDVLDDRPAQVGNARRFLSTYLEGAERVARGYARTYQQAENMELDDKFRNVLATIESAFDQQRERLLEDEVMDLDVQIEVLTTQIEREGV